MIEGPNSRIAPRVALGSPAICVMEGVKVLPVLNEKCRLKHDADLLSAIDADLQVIFCQMNA